MKSLVKGLIACALALIGLQTLAERFDMSTAMAHPAGQTGRESPAGNMDGKR